MCNPIGVLDSGVASVWADSALELVSTSEKVTSVISIRQQMLHTTAVPLPSDVQPEHFVQLLLLRNAIAALVKYVALCAVPV